MSRVFTAKRVIVFLVIVVIAGGIALFVAMGNKSSQSNNPGKTGTYAVKRGSMTISVTENGDIQAIKSKDINSEVEGRTTIISIVDEGIFITEEDVNEGKVLVELDSSEIKQRLTQQEISFLSAEASLAEATESLDIQKKQNESDIEKARMKMRFCLIDFKKYLGQVVAEEFLVDVSEDANAILQVAVLLDHLKLSGEASKKLKELKDNIVLTESKYVRAKDKLQSTRKLFAKGYVAEDRLKGDILDVNSLTIKMEKAEIELDLFRQYEFPKEAEKFYCDHTEAIRELDRTQAGARSKLAQAQARLGSRKATYQVQKQLLEKYQKQLKACVIKAPSPGQIVYSSTVDRWMRRNQPIEVGAEIRERQKIITIPGLTAMKVEINVHETWVDKVGIGQKAKITVSAFPEKEFTGKVIKKSPLAVAQHWLNEDLKTYATEVNIEGTHDFLKTGMSAKVVIIIEELEDILYVPLQSVVNREGKKLCYLDGSAGPKAREVETGAFNNDFVEIKSGLAEGDKVLLNPPRLSELKESES